MQRLKASFLEKMDDDFNSAKAIGVLFDFSRVVNRALDEQLGPDARAAARGLLRLGGILGLFWKKPEAESWDPKILELVGAREEARRTRDWKQADALRQQLLDLGITVEDGADGSKIRRR